MLGWMGWRDTLLCALLWLVATLSVAYSETTSHSSSVKEFPTEISVWRIEGTVSDCTCAIKYSLVLPWYSGSPAALAPENTPSSSVSRVNLHLCLWARQSRQTRCTRFRLPIHTHRTWTQKTSFWQSAHQTSSQPVCFLGPRDSPAAKEEEKCNSRSRLFKLDLQPKKWHVYGGNCNWNST